MMADRMLAFAVQRMRTENPLLEAALMPLPALIQALATAERYAATRRFSTEVERLAIDDPATILSRLPGARLAAPRLWIEFPAEQKDAVRTRLLAAAGRPLPPRPTDQPMPLNLGYFLVQARTSAAVTVSLVAEVLDPSSGIGLAVSPLDVVVDVRQTARIRMGEEADRDKLRTGDPIEALEARIDLRPSRWSPRAIGRLQALAPDLDDSYWHRDLLSEALSICAAIGLVGHPGTALVGAAAAPTQETGLPFRSIDVRG